jgi:hypothetical protein
MFTKHKIGWVGLGCEPKAELLKGVLNNDYLQIVILIWKEIIVINNEWITCM